MGIEVRNLSKNYRVIKRSKGMRGAVKQLIHPQYETIEAVKDISFYVADGDIVGLIGPNGAGKSTIIKLLVDILYPDFGTININGTDIQKNKKKYKSKIGVVFGQRSQLWWDIPIIESFKLYKEMYKISEDIFKKNMMLFDDILDLYDFYYKPARQLSLGQRMRADLCAALLHNPEVLFLDEPTIGIDIVAKEKMRKFIKEINREKKTTIILTTHDIGDIENLSDELVLIDKGKLIYHGNIESLKSDYGRETVIVVRDTSQRLEQIKAQFNISNSYMTNDGALNIVFSKDQYSINEVMYKLIGRFSPKDIKIRETSLEEVEIGRAHV